MSVRGGLRIYLGAAPGVGKTFAMLDEGHRRRARGADVVVGFVETHARPRTTAQLGDLEVIPRLDVAYRGGHYPEMDVDAVLARRPDVVLVDELAHTNVPGSGASAKRWQDVERLRDAGIEVLSTVNAQHLESLNDVVERITGVPQRETVPDAMVRAADQVQLVDQTPEALRRRMAHGNIYPAEKIDAALGNYFRPGNLTALRELTLLWLADQVEEGLQRYREQHGITGPWETRERVVVALTGGPEGDAIIRRAARIAARSTGADLVAVHVSRNDGTLRPGAPPPGTLVGQRVLVESLGGSYHSVVAEDVPRALIEFARGVDATQIVLGASRRRSWSRAVTGPGTGQTVSRLSGPIDVHLVGHDYAARRGRLPSLGRGLTPRRRTAGVLVAAVLLAAATFGLAGARDSVRFASDLSIYLFVVVVVSLVGGFWPALLAALAGSVLLNYYLAPPVHTFTISDQSNIVALVVFLLVAVLVSRVVDVSAARSSRAVRATAEAETLGALATSLLRGEQALDALLARVRETFGIGSVALLRRDDTAGAGWRTLAALGPHPPRAPREADAAADLGEATVLAAVGRPLSADDQRLFLAFGAQVAVAYQQRRLAAAAAAAGPLAEAERARTALLNAVSHDLRTPLAAAKAAVSGLRSTDVEWSPVDRAELLHTADDALDRLTDLVTNLLDLSRLQAGVLPVLVAPVELSAVVARALDHSSNGHDLQVDVPDDLPSVRADAGLLERVVANLVQNAIRYAPVDSTVRVAASAHAGQVELRVVDRGPGIPPDEAERVFTAFQRHDDAPSDGVGVGLGLAIARGFTEAMAGEVVAEQTPGGGATLVVRLPAVPGMGEP